MSLYDDLDSKQRPDKVDGWSSGIKLLQSQLAAKRKYQKPPERNESPLSAKKPAFLPPVIDLKSKKEDEREPPQRIPSNKLISRVSISPPRISSDHDWETFEDEYDPMWPNEYEKLVKDKRERDEKRNNGGSKRRRKSDDSTGFAGRRDDEEESKPTVSSNRSSIGAAIAPPPSLQDSSPSESKVTIPAGIASNYGKGGVAAKIMAKYGFKDGQGLGKQEQGMAVALQVEKTSKRGGRIIHEKEMAPPSPPPPQPVLPEMKYEPSITEIMKSPSKVVLLRNMVGPGDVDEELEPEVKDECNTKYGEVVKVVIHELAQVVPEEAVRIFVEFKRIESAIKAVVDLNGRFFGGRQVRAGFYNFDKFQNMQLMG